MIELLKARPVYVHNLKRAVSVFPIAVGHTKERIVYGEKVMAYPMAAFFDGSSGVALIDESGRARYWSSEGSKTLINTWRGMRLADLIDDFDVPTLRDCLFGARVMSASAEAAASYRPFAETVDEKIAKAAIKRILSWSADVEDELAQIIRNRFPDADRIRAELGDESSKYIREIGLSIALEAREMISAAVPENLSNLLRLGESINPMEIELEVNAGHIQQTYEVNKFLRAHGKASKTDSGERKAVDFDKYKAKKDAKSN